jgi:hypothetical protein
LEVQKLDDLFHGLTMPQLLPSQTQHGAERILAEPDVSAQQEVIESRHVKEEAKVLKGPGNAPSGYGVRREAMEPLSLEPNLSFVRVVNIGDTVEEARFPRAVGPDDRKNFIFVNFEVYTA